MVFAGASVTLAGAGRAYCKCRLNKSFLLLIVIVFLVGKYLLKTLEIAFARL